MILKKNEVLIKLIKNDCEVYIGSIVVPPNNKWRQYGVVVNYGADVDSLGVNDLVLIPNFVDLKEHKKFTFNYKDYYLLLPVDKIIGVLEAWFILARIGFDIDGVIRNIADTVVALLLKKGYRLVNPNTYYFNEMFEETKKYKSYYELLQSFTEDEIATIYVGASVIKDAKYVIDVLKNNFNFEIYFISKQVFVKNDDTLSELTNKFLKNNSIYYDKLLYINTNDRKSVFCNKYSIDIFIDDFLENYIDILYNTKCIPILFTGYSDKYNIDYTTNDVMRIKAIGVPVLTIKSHMDLLKFFENGVLINLDNSKKKTYGYV